MQIGILIETIRREGFELNVSPPKVIFKKIDGIEHEPFEEVFLQIPSEYMSDTLETLNTRLADIEDLSQDRNGISKISILFIK
jgi:GTP-binding protein